MSKYISEECKQCDEWFDTYGCANHRCTIYEDYEQGMEEMAVDFDHDKRKEEEFNE